MSIVEVFPAGRRPDIDPYRLGRSNGGDGRGRYDVTGRREGVRLRPASSPATASGSFSSATSLCSLASLQPSRSSDQRRPGGHPEVSFFNRRVSRLRQRFLLASSFACGIAAVAANARSHLWTQIFLLLTGLLGAGFLLLEAQEFAGLIHQGNRPQRALFSLPFSALSVCTACM